MDKLLKCKANYAPLSPITFCNRATAVYSDRISVIYRRTKFTWKQTHERCCRLASSLLSLNIVKNDVVSVLAPNVPALYEMHFAVPMAGAVLNAINTKLDASSIATILKHSEAKIFFIDYEYVPVALQALQQLPEAIMPLVVVIDDIDEPTGVRVGKLEYEQLVHNGNPGFTPREPEDEWDAITLNYTSGTTAAPKGVVYSHRGAYLSTMTLILQWEMKSEPVYMWSLPMFHCNGWTFTWGVAARGGTNVCIRNTTAAEMYRAINDHKVTHMCCAPIVFSILIKAQPHERCRITTPVEVLTGGAPPAASLLKKIEGIGFHVTHAYGLTEATGPALVCEWQSKWNQLPQDDQANLKARQGLSVLTLADVDVKDLTTMASMPRDGRSMGEIVLRGSSIMKGYLKDPVSTNKAFKKGWFITGDMGVIHPDGYLEIKDRSKDVIISGGENISSVEVDAVLCKHPRVLEAAVVAMPHPYFGETPCAFVILNKESRNGREEVTEGDLIAFCRQNLPHYMTPKKVVFMDELPKTATGKMEKVKLRALASTYQISDQNTPSNKNSLQVIKKQRSQRTIQHEPQEQVFALSRL